VAGARRIFAIDPVPWKLERARSFGATHTAADVTAALSLIRDVTWGRMCNVVVATMGVGRGDLMADIMVLTAKSGRVVVTNVHPVADDRPVLSLLDLAHWEKRIVGCIFGSVNSGPTSPGSSGST
jgi:S-(hydroxymethyl)glutathione dehydrogenase/alcohol dehydrogenase